jgi:hypothetical protein
MMGSKVTLSPGTGAQFGISAGTRAGGYGNPTPYLLPWATAFALLALAMLIRFGLARDSFSWYWSAFTLLVYGALTWVTRRASRARGPLTCGLATTGVALAGAWSWYVAGVGHLTWRPFAVYAGFSVVICGGSMMFSTFRHGHGDGDANMHERLGGAIAKLRNLNEIQAKDGQVVARYAMEPGTPAAELQGAGPALASLYGVAPDGVRVLPSKDNASVGELRISPTNPLRESPPWPGPSIRFGGSIMDPIVAGTRRGGQPLQLWLPGDAAVGRNASLIQVTGMPGAGKTEFIRLAVIELLSRGMPDEVEYWYGNSRKADQEPDWVKRGAARFERDRKGVGKMLRDLRDEAPERARILGEQGLDQWAPGCGLAFRLVVCDEFADVAPDMERVLTDLAETLRSLGVILLCGFQRASGNRFPTDARSCFGTHVCFGVKDETDAAMALPEEVLDAGAAPWLWTNKVPGMCYLSAPGVEEDLWTEDARTFRPNRDLMARWAEHYLAVRAGQARPGRLLDDLQGDTDRLAETADQQRRAAPAAAAATGDSGDGEDLDVDEREREALDDVINLDDIDECAAADEAQDVLREVADDVGDGDLDEDDDEDMPARPLVPTDCREAIAVDHCEPIKVDGGGMRLSLSPQMPPQEARQHVRQFLAALREQGITKIKKEDVGGELLAAVGYRASWLTKVLGECCAERPTWLRVTDERGWYEIVGTPARAIRGDAA